MHNTFLTTEFPIVYYGKKTDEIFKFIQDNQLKDVKLWKILVKQFQNKTDDKDYGWRGEFWGKLMRSACLIYSYTKDKQLYNILSNTVDEIIKTQESSGRISAYKLQREFHGWDMWCRKYVLLGLEYYLDICKDEAQKTSIVNSLIRQADYILAHVGAGKIPINKTSGIWGGLNSYSILQPVVKLYKITGDVKYKEFAEYIIENQDVDGMNFFRAASENKFPPYKFSVTKAYEMISCFEGALELYEAVKDESLLKTCVNYADAILKTDYTIVGGLGCRSEYFDHSSYRQVVSDPSTEMQETCITVTFMKFLAKLFFNTGDVKYIDAIERSFYNAYLGTINEDYGKNKFPIFLSYSPITNNPRWKQIGGKKDISFSRYYGCCISIGGAGLGVIPKCGAVMKGDTVYLNLFEKASYSFGKSGENIKFEVLGNYPYDGNISVKFTQTTNNSVKFKLRKPDWCKSFSISIAGNNVDCPVKDGYIDITEFVHNGVDVNYNMDMPYEFICSSVFNGEIDYRTAVSCGPIVLAKDDYKEDIPFVFDETKKEPKKTILKNGKIAYEVPISDGTLIILNNYSDCGKKDISTSKLNVWFRKK